MKLFVAGFQTIFSDDPEEECRLILKKHLPEALKLAPKGSTVLLVWYEYALTEIAIPHETKKRCLQILQAGLANHSNVILVPGSFASLKPYGSKPEKLEKIKNVYQYRFMDPEETHDKEMIDEYHNLLIQEKRMQEGPLLGHYLKNKGSVLTKFGQFGQKKVNIFEEYRTLVTGPERLALSIPASLSFAGEKLCYRNSPTALKNWIVDPGVNKLTRKIQIADTEFINMRLLICRDQDKDNSIPPDILPLLEVIVSNTIRINTDTLWGAVTIHMDYVTGLSVYVNDLHPERMRVESISACNFQNIFKPVPIKTMNREVVEEDSNSLPWD